MGKTILSIETSCDETSIAIADFRGPKTRARIRILSHVVLSQIPVHKKFGGVVPNLAKREHQKNLVPILLQTLKESGMWNVESSNKKSYSTLRTLHSILEREPELLARFRKNVLLLKPPPIDSIAVTYGPGLAPALWVGVNFAKALAYLWSKPLIPVNHMAGHLYSALLQKEPRISKSQFPISKQIPKSKLQIPNIKFPALALLVSGGHTELILVRGHPVRGVASNGASGKFKILGETLDDAAGEAFDKVARLLDLPYPGGPAISKEAEKNFQFPIFNFQIKLPRPMINSKDYNFSFSGLKTAVFYLVRDLGPQKTRKLRPLIAKEFQDAVVEVLVKKTIRAAKEYKIKTLLLGGGVAANKLLRRRLEEAVASELVNTRYWPVVPKLAGDNALMIAAAAYFTLPPNNKYRPKIKYWKNIVADANARLEN